MEIKRTVSGGWIAYPPAKINLFFEVLGKRNDNFHDIVSIALPIRLCDELSVRRLDNPAINLSGITEFEVPLDNTNLIVRAAQLIQKRYKIPYGADFCLHKKIPAQAGLGGGSSNASAALLLACKMWDIDVTDAELIALASEIGSDCPIFFYNAPTLSTGRGEKIEPLPKTESMWFVLLKPPEGLSTGKVYAECMPTHAGNFRKPDNLISALAEGNMQKIGRNLFNRLEFPARKLWPRFEEIQHILLSSGCLAVQMSGSGTAFFGLCENENQAKNVYQTLHRIIHPGCDLFLTQSF